VTGDVILAPGLWMPASTLWLLAARLQRAGYAPHLFSYSGRAYFDENVERLARFARETIGSRAAHFIGHSLGGLLVLETLNRHADIPVASALLLGSPARGSLAGRRFSAGRFGRWMMGDAASSWEAREAHWARAAPLGVVAGTVAFGLARIVGGQLPGLNDGVVCVDETAVVGMADAVQVPVAHSLLATSGTVGRLAQRFLRTGSFA
jgi:pimeloyl-ACP methyl ester carboxylesterase